MRGGGYSRTVEQEAAAGGGVSDCSSGSEQEAAAGGGVSDCSSGSEQEAAADGCRTERLLK